MIKALNLPGLALIALGLPQAATAEMAAPVLTDLGVTRVGRAEATRLYRADLTGLGLSAIGTITVNDSNSGTGGGGGVHSGFDLDVLFLDVDGDLATTADRILATDHDFSVGSIRRGGVRRAPSGGPTMGALSETTIDEAFATLGQIDAAVLGPGYLTLGDGGCLTVYFDPPIPVGPSLYLFAGEVKSETGEALTGLVKVARSGRPTPASTDVPCLCNRECDGD